MLQVEGFSYDENDKAAHSRHIRTEVFVKEQGVPAELEYDEYDVSARHYLLYLDGKPIATARWRETPKGIKLERFAMLKAYRNRGLGIALLEAVMEDVLPLGKEIYLNAQEKAVSYYGRYGFIKKGPAFMEAGIRHFRMEWPSA